MRKFAYFIAFCCLLATVRALNCRTGYKVSSQIITGDEWVDEECPTDDPHSCIRSEGVIVIFGAHTVNITYGACADQTTCEQTCEQLAHSTLVTVFASAAAIHPSVLKYTLDQCRMTCCDNDLCNENSVRSIENAKQMVSLLSTEVSTVATTTTAPPTPSTTTEDNIFECHEGYEVSSSVLVSEHWNTSYCRRDLQQKCIRGEGIVNIANLLDVNVTTAFCANRSACEDSCRGLFRSVLVNLDQPDLTLESCVSACCDEDSCNENPIATWPEEDPTTSETTALTTPATTTTTTAEAPTTTTLNTTPPQSTLTCASGYQLTSSLISEKSLAEARCPLANQKCLRSEVEAYLFESVEVSLITASCVDASVCELSCEDLSRTLFLSNQSSSSNIENLDIGTNDFNLTSCRFSCCEYNNCNNKSVIQLAEENGAKTINPALPPVNPLPQATEAPAIECYSGYQADSSVLSHNYWRLAQCSSAANQRCIRAEAQVTIYEILEVDVVVGFCADAAECDNAVCDDLASYLLSGSSSPFEGLGSTQNDFIVNRCRSLCCNHESGCNNNSIAELALLPQPEEVDQDGKADPGSSFVNCPAYHANGECNDENSLFLLSLASRLSSLPRRTASEVKIRIMELFHEAEFGNLNIR